MCDSLPGDHDACDVCCLFGLFRGEPPAWSVRKLLRNQIRKRSGAPNAAGTSNSNFLAFYEEYYTQPNASGVSTFADRVNATGQIAEIGLQFANGSTQLIIPQCYGGNNTFNYNGQQFTGGISSELIQLQQLNESIFTAYNSSGFYAQQFYWQGTTSASSASGGYVWKAANDSSQTYWSSANYNYNNSGNAVVTESPRYAPLNNGGHLLADGPLHTLGNQIVDQYSNAVKISATTWSGFETVDHVVQGVSDNSYENLLNYVKSQGFNTIRLPFSTDLIDHNLAPRAGQVNYDPNLAAQSGLTAMGTIVDYANQIGLKVVLTYQRSSAGSGTSDKGLWYDNDYQVNGHGQTT